MSNDVRLARTAVPLRKGLLFGMSAALIWGGYLAFARAGIADGLRPEDFALLRFGAAALVMLPFLLKTGVTTLAGVGWKRSFVLAIFAGPLFMLLIPGGYLFAPLAHGAVIPPAATVVCSLLAAAVFLGDRPTVSRIVAVGAILAGLVCIAGSGFFAEKGTQAWIGDLMFFSAGLLWAIFTVLQQRWNVGPMQATTALSVMSLILLLPPFLAWSSFDRLLALPPTMLAAQILIQGVLAGAVAVIAYVSAVVALGASRAAVFPALVPAIAILIGIPLTGEWPSALQWIGIAVVTLGLLAALGVRLPMPAAKRA